MTEVYGMAASLGERLRQRREDRGITLRTIADETKIKLSLLEGLERDDISHWPAGIFTRAYLRAYAHAIHLDPDVVVREFLEIHPEPVDDQAGSTATAEDAARRGGAPQTRLRQIVGSAFESLLRRAQAGDEQIQAPSLSEDVPTGPRPLLVAPSVAPSAAMPSAATPSAAAPSAATVSTPAAVSSPPPVPDVAATRVEPKPEAAEVDFLAVAKLCTHLGRVQNAGEVQPLLKQAAGILGATGLIVWVWDGVSEGLRPALTHGYSRRVLGQLRPVGRDEDNATAAAFRSARASVIKGSDRNNGALVLPLMIPAGCAGVLAIELHNGTEQVKSIRAAATMFAALLAQLVGSSPAEEATQQSESSTPDLKRELTGSPYNPLPVSG